jgi:hypothetical protein
MVIESKDNYSDFQYNPQESGICEVVDPDGNLVETHLVPLPQDLVDRIRVARKAREKLEIEAAKGDSELKNFLRNHQLPWGAGLLNQTYVIGRIAHTGLGAKALGESLKSSRSLPRRKLALHANAIHKLLRPYIEPKKTN